MLTPRENFLETIKKGGSPDRIIDQYEGLHFFPPNPVSTYIRGNRQKGMPPLKDRWGTTILWPEGQFAAMPHVTAENCVISDVTKWKEQVTIPDVAGNCSDPSLWEDARAAVAKIDREQSLYMAFGPTGVFERLHFLMPFEEMLMNFLLEPEAMMELCDALGDYRLECAKLVVENLRPDAILSHDDWGSKANLFMSPDAWRQFIKPQYEKTYKYLKDNGVIIIHHADSFMEPIVEDMAQMGIDVWQGVLPENDIPGLQKQLDGRMALMGGIDAARVDRADATEDEIRADVRKVCQTYTPAGNFIPCITYGGPGCMYPHVDSLISDEIRLFNEERVK